MRTHKTRKARGIYREIRQNRPPTIRKICILRIVGGLFVKPFAIHALSLLQKVYSIHSLFADEKKELQKAN
jgi:hypothetical protein